MDYLSSYIYGGQTVGRTGIKQSKNVRYKMPVTDRLLSDINLTGKKVSIYPRKYTFDLFKLMTLTFGLTKNI